MSKAFVIMFSPPEYDLGYFPLLVYTTCVVNIWNDDLCVVVKRRGVVDFFSVISGQGVYTLPAVLRIMPLVISVAVNNKQLL